MLNPESGLVITANNAAIGEQYPYLLTDDWDYGQRANRITDLLAQATAGARRSTRRDVPDPAGHLQRERGDLVPRLQVVSGLDEPDCRSGGPASRAGTSTTTEAPRQRAYFNAFWRNLQDPLFNDELAGERAFHGGGRWWS